jgi:hypothetical protein
MADVIRSSNGQRRTQQQPCSSKITGMESVPEEVAEIATKFKFAWTQRSFQKDVADLKKKIRAELNKEMRMKHGYVQLQKATKDRKQNEVVKGEIRDLCDLISDMQCDLQTLSMYDTGAFDDDESTTAHLQGSPLDSPHGSATGLVDDGEMEAPVNPKLLALQKELDKELKVKEGLERFLSLSPKNHLNPRAYSAELLNSSREMYEDCKAKIALLQMQIEPINPKLLALQKELDKELKVKEGLERFLSLSTENHLNPRAYTAELLHSSRVMHEDNKAKIVSLRTQIDRLQKQGNNENFGETDKKLAEGTKNMLKALSKQLKPKLERQKRLFRVKGIRIHTYVKISFFRTP